MAGKNQVILTFSGDSKSLERTFDRVGAGSKSMARTATGSFDKLGDSSRRAARTAKGLQGALGGLVASGQGVAAIMQGDVLGGLLMLEGGFGKVFLSVAKLTASYAVAAARWVADTARMVASTVAQAAVTVAHWVVMGAQALIAGAKMALAWIIGLGPVGLVIAGIAAVIAILVKLGVGFDDIKRIASGVFNWIKSNWPLLLAILTGPIGLAVLAIARNWDTIKSGASRVVEAIKGFFGSIPGAIVGFFSGLPGKVKSLFEGLGQSIVGGFKALWNNTIGGFGFTFGGFDPPGPGSIPGFSFHIPEMHQGGIFPGAPGTEGLALLQAGERVIPAGRGGTASVVVNVYGSLLTDERKLVRVIRDELARGGFSGVLP